MHWREGVESRRNTADCVFMGSREASQRSKMSCSSWKPRQQKTWDPWHLLSPPEEKGQEHCSFVYCGSQCFGHFQSFQTSLFSDR